MTIARRLGFELIEKAQARQLTDASDRDLGFSDEYLWSDIAMPSDTLNADPDEVQQLVHEMNARLQQSKQTKHTASTFRNTRPCISQPEHIATRSGTVYSYDDERDIRPPSRPRTMRELVRRGEPVNTSDFQHTIRRPSVQLLPSGETGNAGTQLADEPHLQAPRNGVLRNNNLPRSELHDVSPDASCQRLDNGSQVHQPPPASIAAMGRDTTNSVCRGRGTSGVCDSVAVPRPRAQRAGRQRRVDQLHLSTDVVLHSFESLVDAVRSHGKADSFAANLAACCRGERSAALGFGWQWSKPEESSVSCRIESTGNELKHEQDLDPAQERTDTEHAAKVAKNKRAREGNASTRPMAVTVRNVLTGEVRHFTSTRRASQVMGVHRRKIPRTEGEIGCSGDWQFYLDSNQQRQRCEHDFANPMTQNPFGSGVRIGEATHPGPVEDSLHHNGSQTSSKVAQMPLNDFEVWLGRFELPQGGQHTMEHLDRFFEACEVEMGANPHQHLAFLRATLKEQLLYKTPMLGTATATNQPSLSLQLADLKARLRSVVA